MSESIVAAETLTPPAYRQLATGVSLQFGYIAALITVCIWASWLLAVKMGSMSVLTSFDLALMRYAVPALVLWPFLYKGWGQIRQVPIRLMVGMVLGAGVPFFFLSSAGMTYAPAAHAGLLIPGTFPLFVTAIAVLVYQETLTGWRWLGVALIGLGVMTLVTLSWWHAAPGTWKGDLLFLAASACWAVFTVCLRVAGLPPLVATALLTVISTVLLGGLWAVGIVQSGLAQASWSVVLPQLMVQGILVGLLTGFSYGFAIARIGAERAAAVGSLTPVLVTLFAVPLLQEALTWAAMIAILLICCGVLFASGLIRR